MILGGWRSISGYFDRLFLWIEEEYSVVTYSLLHNAFFSVFVFRWDSCDVSLLVIDLKISKDAYIIDACLRHKHMKSQYCIGIRILCR